MAAHPIDTREGESRDPEWFGAGLFFAYAVVVLARSAVPSMTDYANWTYQGVLLARHLQGFADASHLLKHYPVPNSTATLGIGILALFLPWQLAAKLWLSVQLLISFVCLRSLVQTTKANRLVWFLVPSAVFFGTNWWYGFVNFELGLAWVMLIASLLLQRAHGIAGRDWAIGLVLVLAFFTHMIPFALCVLFVVLYAGQTGRWRVLWQLLPAALLSIWYVVGRYSVAHNADGQAGMVASIRDYSLAFWVYKLNSYAKSFGFANPADLHGSITLALAGMWMFLLLILVTLLLAIFIIAATVREVSRVYAERAAERFLWTGLLLLLPIYWFAPGTALGVSDPGSRLLQTSLAISLVLVCRNKSALLSLSAACALILGLAGLSLFARVELGTPLHGAPGTGLPRAVVHLGHVPFSDQDYLYTAIERGDFTQSIFPTGMFLNTPPR